MRVLHVAPSIAISYGGPTQSLVGFLHATTTIGIRADLVAPASGDADRERLRDALGDGELHVFPGLARGAAIVSPGLLLWLHRHAARYDVIHVHGLLNPTSSLGARLAIMHSTALVVRPFGMLSRYTALHRRRRLKRAYTTIIDRPNLRRAAALHFTSERERDESTWHALPEAAPRFVIPPPLIPILQATPRRNPDNPTVLFLGRLNPVKSVELLLEAWRDVAAHIDARLVIAGSGDPDYERHLRELAKPYGDRVHFAGFVTGKAKEAMLNDADLFVLPSLHENLGVAVLEAIAAGLPVVVTPEVQTGDFIERHGLGLVSERNPSALASSIVRALRDPHLARHCALRGADIVRETFSPERVGRQLATMYTTAVDRSQGRART